MHGLDEGRASLKQESAVVFGRRMSLSKWRHRQADHPAGYLLPVARFAGLAWLITAGALLPKARSAAYGLVPEH